MNTQHKHTNLLINESSPYLLQHAHNPVDWHPWNESSLQKAKDENKPLLISIGYSSCHWCHVMEHESFENETIAEIMNKYFICIKVDREERPDVDQIYMDAVHLMKGQGGWPLNCFALPNGKPFFGGTYFRPEQWVDIMHQIHDLYTGKYDQVKDYADKLADGIKQSGMVVPDMQQTDFTKVELNSYFDNFKTMFDLEEGGVKGAPKFPMPNGLIALLERWNHTHDQEILDYLALTADKMAMGGIYDQAGGGFARYSVDAQWKVPHFEKMLYDNAQLITFYSALYKATKKPLYKTIIEETLQFINREMTHEKGGFYSALDADSEGEEGKFYVWQTNEFRKICGHYADLMCDYFRIDQEGYWEQGNNILLVKESKDDFSQRNNLSTTELDGLLKHIKGKLLKVREERIPPGLDDKVLTSWNALMLKAYCDAFAATQNEKYLKTALTNADFILNNLVVENELFHTWKDDKATIPAFHDDYAFLIEAFLSLYEVTGNMDWLKHAERFTEKAIEKFYSKTNQVFFFTESRHDGLIARKAETMDNVIPASNSAMANILFVLGSINHNEEYLSMAKQMLKNVKANMLKYSTAFSNWSILAQNIESEFKIIVICGDEAEAKRKDFMMESYSGAFVMSSTKEEDHPYFTDRFKEGKTMIYVCKEGECKLPVQQIKDAIDLI